jgi:hypothetical protein
VRWANAHSFYLFIVVLGMEPRALHVLSKFSATELSVQSHQEKFLQQLLFCDHLAPGRVCPFVCTLRVIVYVALCSNICVCDSVSDSLCVLRL